ncbi:MAG: hypothetical protein JNK82_13645, partial [Myxococcaceae bacterium]|nr:hypothetical protein [Myxococcaceae bacterium]
MTPSLRLYASLAVLFAAAACSNDKTTTPSAAARAAGSARLALATDLSLVASTPSPAVGANVELKLTAPVHADASLISQTLSLSFDKSRMTPAGAPIVPEGWATTYYAGATPLDGGPSTPAQWASVTRIVATGSVESDGSAAGQQVIVGNAGGTIPPPPTASTFSGGSAGDGWDVIFSPDRKRVFNIHHHDSPPTVMCRNASDGSTCGTGYPFSLYHSSNRSTGWIDADTGRFWHETFNGSTAGWECVDVSGVMGTTYSAPAYCPTRFVSAGFGAGNYDVHIDLVNVGKELYSLDTNSGRLTCLDVSANGGAGAPCPGQPYAGFGGVGAGTVSLIAIENKVYVHGSNKVMCFDPATKAACGNGFPSGGHATTKVRPIMAVPDALGALNVCVQGDCWALNGGASSLPSNFVAFMAANPVDSGCCGTHYSKSAYGNTKLFFPMSSNRLQCWDSATNAKCATTGTGAVPYPLTVNQIYTAVIDPLNANCLWTNSHDGVIRTWDVPSGTAGCKAPPPPPPVATYYPQAVIPRLACDGATRIGAWKTFKVLNPEPSEYTSATVTIKDSTGAEIAGWVNVAVPVSQVIDLTGLTTAMTGPNPAFSITFVGMQNDITGGAVTGGPSSQFKVLGDSPQMCLTAKMRSCASGLGVFPSDPVSTTVTGEGSAALSGNPAVAFTAAQVSLND